MNKKIMKFIKETILITLFAIWILNFSINFITAMEEIKKTPIKDLWKISILFILPNPIFLLLYLPLLPLLIFISGTVNLSINHLSKKYVFTLGFRNKSKRFNSFFTYLIKGVSAISLTFLVWFSSISSVLSKFYYDKIYYKIYKPKTMGDHFKEK